MKKLSKKKVIERRKSGIVKAYMSRAAAIRKLQLPLSDFRRLCILKGVYPVEPKNKSKLTGANTKRKTYFYTRDIQYLINEPILHKFWEFKVFMKRLTRAKGRHDLEKFQRTLDNKPYYKLDTVVKERYPRFIDALRDCDDALSMCFLFAMFPKGKGRPDDLIDFSRRLTIEFMLYVIHSKSLRKVFISIKGYYYQAEIMGQTLTWIVPHQFVIDRVSNVDMNVMKTFTEFYVTLLGFINYKLYKSIGATFPPDLGDYNDESLNKALRTQCSVEKHELPDDFEEFTEENDDNPKLIRSERLFEGLRFFLNREVPRTSLTFVIRSFGGEVIWDDEHESDASITHHLIDRDSVNEQHLNRVYIQPQWIYDSINMKILLPTDEYLIGAKLPPHLSPFVNEKRGDYVPPDKLKLLKLRKEFEAELEAEGKSATAGESELETEDDLELETEDESAAKTTKQKFDNKDKPNKSTSRSKMSVKPGKLRLESKEELKSKEDAEHRKLGIMMIPKKKKRLFDKITKTRRQKNKKAENLRVKRRIVEHTRQRK